MKKVRKYLSLFLCAVIVAMSFSSCSGLGKVKSPTAEIDDNNQLRLPVFNTDSLNPYEAKTQYNFALATLLFEGLVKVKEDFTVENAIAESVSVEDTTVTVKINPASCFSDGSMITSADVEYSYSLAKQNDNFKKQLENFDGIDTAGNVVKFTLKKADVYASLCLDFPIIKEVGEDSENIIGSGKYKFENSNTLIMNELFRGKELPKVRRIRLVNMLDNQSGTESVEKGTISYFLQEMTDGSYLRKNVKTNEIPLNNLVFLGINSENEHLKNAEVRQAISLLVPKETIVEESFLGYAQVTDTPFYPGWKEIEKIRPAEKSEAINEATELLESAGYSKGNDVLASVMRLRIIVNDDNAFKVSAAENIALALKSVGITAVVEKIPFSYFVQRLERGEYELYIGETKLTKNMSLSPFFSYGGGASYGISSTSKIATTYDDFLSGKVTLQRFVDYFDVAVPFVPICYRSGIEMYTNELSVEKFGTVTDRFENIYSWYY